MPEILLNTLQHTGNLHSHPNKELPAPNVSSAKVEIPGPQREEQKQRWNESEYSLAVWDFTSVLSPRGKKKCSLSSDGGRLLGWPGIAVRLSFDTVFRRFLKMLSNQTRILDYK